MQQVISSNNKPIKLWLDELEKSALEQAKNLADLPFTYKWVALMPDCHTGYFMPIGTVLATEKVIIPAGVGVDIGCGMQVVETKIPIELLLENDKKLLKEIMGEIRKVIPVGFNKHKEVQSWFGFESLAPDIKIIQSNLENAIISLGTLGGGNHFIELQKDKENNLWIMLHSGSRNLGKQICDYYHKLAAKLNQEWHSNIDLKKQPAFLPINSKEGKEYYRCMIFALEFAKENRNHMMNNIQGIILKKLNCTKEVFKEDIDIHHNYATIENHFGKNVIIHRKGATSAKKGEIGIIPGSQGTNSYIVEGLGNLNSFMSCSHGAGRLMSRTKARNELNLEKEKKKLEGIIHSIRNKKDLDEAAGAYKPIDTVMKNQEDLVKIKTELTPIGVIKG